MMVSVVSVIGSDARLWMNGIRRVRMMWTIRVWVSSDSTNQPVWNSCSQVRPSGRGAAAGSTKALQLKKNQHQDERGVVEDRADRPDEDHEAF